jgi:S-adenosylmethionine/arginine decarboxylase-like enzyme
MTSVKHKHLIVRAEVSSFPNDPAWADNWMMQLVQKIGMKILMGPFSKYCDVPGNKGLTSVVIIETSHIVLHTWTERENIEVQLDVYTCSDLDPNDIFDELENFGSVLMEYKFLDRENGLREVMTSQDLLDVSIESM